MENDIYRQIIRELSKKSERDFGFKRVEDEKAKITQYIWKGVYLLLQLTIIIIISSILAGQYREVSVLSINLYLVGVCVALLGVLNYPSLWRKFTRKPIIIIIMIICVLIALKVTVPSKIIPLIDQPTFFFSWGVIVAFTSFAIYIISGTVVASAEMLLDLASIFLPVLPTTFGSSLPDLTAETYKILSRETFEKETGENDLKYLISAAQVDIDTAAIRSLPWVVILGFGATNFSEIDVFLSPVNLFLGFPLLLIGILAIFNIARITYFQTVIIQVANRLLIDLPKKDREQQENLSGFVVLTDKSKSGCLWRILFP